MALSIDYAHYEHIAVSRQPGGILTLTLNRPERLNAVNPRLHYELSRIFVDVAEDDEARVVIITGAGRAFCAGGDINDMQNPDTPAEFEKTHREGVLLISRLLELPQPTIARVKGSAVGLGATLALYCDFIVATKDAKFADPHVNVGLVAGDGGVFIWPLILGPVRAREFLMLGKSLSGEQAEKWGLVNYAVDEDELDKTTMELAEKLANGPQLAIRWTKMAINQMLRALAPQVITSSLALEGLTFATQDHREAVSAFLEKRTPRFTGK